MSYNGWSNYETWAVALWMDNDAGTYGMRCDVMQDAWDVEASKYLTRSENARQQLAKWLKDFVEEMAPDLGASLFSDLLSAALSEVNWSEIADNWLTEVDGYERAA